MSVSDAAFAQFQLLTQRPFIVLDTEYTPDPDGDGQRLISVGVTRVVRGRRASAGEELYVEMNPGVPIDPRTTVVHGFTDAWAARKRSRFADHAAKVLAALDHPGAVLVTHTGADIWALRDEFRRLGEAGGDFTLDDLPDLPLLDTSTLPRQLHLPGVGNRSVVSLATLCDLTNVSNRAAHNARLDARATGDALVKLLLHDAKHLTHDSIDDLLADCARGTLRDPKISSIRRRGDREPAIPAAHAALHASPLTHAGSDQERAAWLDLATECAKLRCPLLRAEASLAAPENGALLLDPLTDLLAVQTGPGQAGTLLGAVRELITAEPVAGRQPTLALSRALKWWARRRPQVQASGPCEDSWKEACPDCREGRGCPRDTLYQPIATIAVLGERGVLTEKSIYDRLLGPREDRRINRWTKTHPDVQAWMMWMIVDFYEERGGGIDAASHLELAMARDFHLREPRLTRVACEAIAGTRGLASAQEVAQEVLAKRTTDPAYDELEIWLTWHEQAAVRAARAAAPRGITHPRLARPPGRVNENPYLPG